MIIAELTGEAKHHAGWTEPDEATTQAAVAALREIAGGRTDLLAEVAGIFLGTSEGELHEPRRATLSASAAPPGRTRT